MEIVKYSLACVYERNEKKKNIFSKSRHFSWILFSWIIYFLIAYAKKKVFLLTSILLIIIGHEMNQSNSLKITMLSFMFLNSMFASLFRPTFSNFSRRFLSNKSILPYEIDRFNGVKVRTDNWPNNDKSIREILTGKSSILFFFLNCFLFWQLQFNNGKPINEHRLGFGFQLKNHISFQSQLN